MPGMKLRSVIYVILGLLTISCNKPYDDSDGLAFIWFEISGTVVDTAGQPVADITVMAESAESVKTDAAGKFTVQGGSAPAETADVRFADANDGDRKFVSKIVSVPLVKFKDGHGWNKGYYRNKETVTVTLVEDAVITPQGSGIGSGQGAGR